MKSPSKWTKLPTRLPEIRRPISDNRVVQGFIDYSLDHCKIIYPAKYQVHFIFDSKEELSNHIWARVKNRHPLFVDEAQLEQQRLAMKEEIAKHDRQQFGFYSWLKKIGITNWYGNIMYRLGRFFREQGDRAMNPKEWKYRTQYVYHKKYETNATKKKRKKQY